MAELREGRKNKALVLKSNRKVALPGLERLFQSTSERKLTVQKRSKDMRSEKALLSSRREFLANALGTAFVMGLLSPISAGQDRSRQRHSSTSTSKAGRTARKTSLNWDVFLAPSIPVITSDLPPGEKERRWPPISSTLISGERDAVLVDTPITVEQARTLVNWIVASGKNSDCLPSPTDTRLPGKWDEDQSGVCAVR